MDVLLFLVAGGGLAWFAVAVLRALDAAHGEQSRREMNNLKCLGLTVSTAAVYQEFSGTVDGWRIVVGRAQGEEAWVRVEAPAIPPGLEMERERPVAAIVGDNDLRIGDDEFDRSVRIVGREEQLFAVLNGETRALLTGGRFIVEESTVRVSVPTGFGSVASLRESIGEAIEVARRLSLPEDQIPQRLARNASEEADLTIRWKNLTLLTDRFPNHPATRNACRAALRDPTMELRYEGARFLRDLEAFLSLVSDRDAGEAVRLRALGHLIENAPLERLAPLLEGLLSSLSPVVKRAAIEALGRLHRPSDVKRLTPLVDPSDGLTNVAIAKALGAIGDKEVEPVLIELLAHEHEETKLEAARALGRVGSVTAVEPLLALTTGFRETELKRVAREAVGHIQRRLGDVHAGALTIAEASCEEGGLTVTSGGGELALTPTEEGPDEVPSKPKAAQTRGS